VIDLSLAILVVTLLAYHILEARAWSAERSRLLDRVMARSYNEFVYSQAATTEEVPQMTSDEAEAAWHEANRSKHPELYPDEVA
jgi:hypothetical protein